MKMDKYIVGIGAANIDIYAKSKIDIREHFDHPSNITTSYGGVTRNILENISKVGMKTVLLSAVGNDAYGNALIDYCKNTGIDCSHVLKVSSATTGMFVQIKDNNNDMNIALCDMNVLSHIDINYIKSNKKIICNSSGIVLDSSLDNKVIEYIIDSFPDKKIFVDPISDYYAKKIKKYLKYFYCVKPNRNELSVLANMPIESKDDLFKAYKKISKKTDVVVVTLNKDGCMYTNEKGEITIRNLKGFNSMINSSGAGDCFAGLLIYGIVNDININECIDLALAGGIATIHSEYTINPKLSIKLLRKIIKENANGL